MPHWSRRQTLQTVGVAGALALAGCSGTTTGSDDVPPAPREQIHDFEVASARNADGDPLFLAGEQPTDTGERTDGDLAARVSELRHLTDEVDLDELRFRDEPGAADLEAFVTATDLESRSVYLFQRPIGECYVPRLVGVFREGDGVDVELCQDLRPADAECDADAEDVIAVAIRLPFAGDEFSGVGGGWSSRCEHYQSDPLTEGGDAA